VLGLDSGPHQYHLTLSALAQAYRPLGAGLLLCWMLGGIGYRVARLRSPRGGAWGEPTPSTEGGPERHDARFAAGVLVGARGPGHGVAPGLLLPQHPAVGVAFWVAVAGAALGIDLVARRSAGRVATAEELVRFVSTWPPVNVLCVAAWVFAGYHLFAR
jgi:hypothetical protein